MRTGFISYSHRQRDWVWGRLKPVLEAGGIEVLIDVERFQESRRPIDTLLPPEHDMSKLDYVQVTLPSPS